MLLKKRQSIRFKKLSTLLKKSTQKYEKVQKSRRDTFFQAENTCWKSNFFQQKGTKSTKNTKK